MEHVPSALFIYQTALLVLILHFARNASNPTSSFRMEHAFYAISINLDLEKVIILYVLVVIMLTLLFVHHALMAIT